MLVYVFVLIGLLLVWAVIVSTPLGPVPAPLAVPMVTTAPPRESPIDVFVSPTKASDLRILESTTGSNALVLLRKDTELSRDLSTIIAGLTHGVVHMTPEMGNPLDGQVCYRRPAEPLGPEKGKIVLPQTRQAMRLGVPRLPEPTLLLAV